MTSFSPCVSLFGREQHVFGGGEGEGVASLSTVNNELVELEIVITESELELMTETLLEIVMIEPEFSLDSSSIILFNKILLNKIWS